MNLEFRSLWLSDVHLGTPACRADDLLDFLGMVDADVIYLVGDIVDLQRMRAKLRFPDSHAAVLWKFAEMAKGNAQVIYIPGNHDFQLRRLVGGELFGIDIFDEAEHTTADGRRLLITHGDILDRDVRHGTNLERFGSAAYAWLIDADARFNRLKAKLGGEFSPLCTGIKMRLRKAQEYIQRFERTAARYAARRNFDGVVCGHIHRPAIQTINGVLYANDGDWVEHRTAIAEDRQGKLILLRYDADGVSVVPQPSLSAQAA